MKNIIKVLLVVMALVLVVSAFVACEQDTTPDCEHKNVEFVLGKNPTCTEDGLTSGFKCKDCGAWTVPQELDPAGHDYIVDVPAKGATCETDGYTAHKQCSRCDAVDGKEVIPATGHNMQKVAAKDPTCTEAGYNEHQACANGCGKTEGKEEIKALGHTAGAAATCTTAQTCTVCKAELAPATGHTAGAAATCTTAQKCTVCNAEIAPATGHTAGAAATCTTAQKCTVCNTVLVAALGHDYVSGDCSRCNSIITYVINSSKWSTVKAYMWTSSNNGWPGATMKKTGEKVNGFDVYSIETTTAYANIIFNNGSGQQTSDLKLMKGQYFYVKDGKWYASLDVVPELDVLSTGITLPGDFNSWSPTANEFKFEKEGDTVAIIKLTLIANKTYQFKVIKDGNWYSNSQTITAANSKVDFPKENKESNMKITTVCAGTYIIKYDTVANKITAVYPDHKEVVLNGKDATCTENGLTEGKKCSACNAILVKQEVIPAGHKLGEDGVCTGCGYIIVSTYEELIAALAKENAKVWMNNDIEASATQNSGYGVAGIVINAGVLLDGNGHKLTINDANSTWDCAIAMKGGEVRNLTIAGAMRGVFMPGANGDVVIDNCVLVDVIYTFNSDAGSKDYAVTIKNTALNGWTSFSDVHKSVTFENCTFGEGSGYAFCRPYQATTFTGCTFAEGFGMDAMQTDAIVLTNCKLADADLTIANVVTLIGEEAGVTATVNGEKYHVHKYAEETVAPTCTVAGKTTYTCPCGDTYTEDVEALGHKVGGDGVCEVCHNVPVSTADELIEALEAGKNVILMNDIVIDPANMSNAYGTTGINIKKGQSLDGNGFVLDIHGAGGTWDSGVNTTGGVIKNIKVTGAFRGVFINHTSDHSEQVVLENVVIEGTTYTISCDQGMQQTLKAVGSTFNGWTSYAATLGSAEFVDCKFGEGNGYAYCRPYSETTFTNCVFEEGYAIDATRTTLTFVNCYVGETLVTAENVVELLGEGAASIVFANN